MAVIGLDGIALKIVGAGTEIIGSSIDRACVANDGGDTAPQRGLQRFPRKTMSEGAARRDDTVNEVRHQAALHDQGRCDMACPLTPRTNDPGGGQKQIQLRYAAI